MRLIDKTKLLEDLNKLEAELNNNLTNVITDLDVRLFSQRLGSWQTLRDVIEIIEDLDEHDHHDSPQQTDAHFD